MANYPVPFVFDVAAMLAWSKATGNEAQIVLGDVQQGTVHIYGRVFKEFLAAYPDEAKIIAVNQIPRQRITDEHRHAAAALAEKANATFGRKGPYDPCIEWSVAGIASCCNGTVVTDMRRIQNYTYIDGLSVITFDDFIADH
jgi:hypothetical protein